VRRSCNSDAPLGIAIPSAASAGLMISAGLHLAGGRPELAAVALVGSLAWLISIVHAG
jgi:hypothetical protein